MIGQFEYVRLSLVVVEQDILRTLFVVYRGVGIRQRLRWSTLRYVRDYVGTGPNTSM